jgi:hypothetical protein
MARLDEAKLQSFVGKMLGDLGGGVQHTNRQGRLETRSVQGATSNRPGWFRRKSGAGMREW